MGVFICELADEGDEVAGLEEGVSRLREYAVRDGEAYEAGLGGLCELLFGSLTGCSIWEELAYMIQRLEGI